MARAHAVVGQDNLGVACGLQVIQGVLQPGVVGIAFRGHATYTVGVAFQTFVSPVSDVFAYVS